MSRHVYRIEPTTGLATLIETSTPSNSSDDGYFIRRPEFERTTTGGTSDSRTSQATIDQINAPSSAPRLARVALEHLQSHARSSGGTFPSNYYVAFSRDMFRSAIRIYGFDLGVSTADANFGVEVADAPSKAPFHVYESIARSSRTTGWDKVQHFCHSAAMECRFGRLTTDAMQYGKEVFYDEIPSWFTDDTGFDDNDMLANNRGQAFGRALCRRAHPSFNVEGWLEAEIYRLYGVPFR